MDITEVKSLLKTYCKQNHYKSPKYKIIFITEDDYKKLYTISVEIKGVLTVADTGISRRIAEKKAAIKALVELKVINKEDVEKTEDQVLVNENNNIIETKLKVEEPAEQPKIKTPLANNEPPPIVKVKVNEVSENSKNILLSKSSTKDLKSGNDLKFIDENLNSKPKKTPNLLNNENKVETKAQSNEQHINNENVTQLNENPICGIIKYCLRTGIPLPFYDFNFNDGQFSTQCRIESNGTEYVGFGRASTLRVAKMVASQEVIDELKKDKLYSGIDDQELVESEYQIEKRGVNENHYTEYSTLTINMKSKEKKKIENNFEDKDFDPKKYSSTFGSRDDNNNPKDSSNPIDKSFEQNYNLIIDNPISYLQKYCSKNKISDPIYEEESRSGQDHCPIFWYNCSLATKDRNIIGIGGGNSKKSAKKAAAEEVVRLLLNL